MITLSRPINWAYDDYGWSHSGLSFLAFCERVFEQTHPPISKAEVIAGFMLQHGADQPERIRNRTGTASQSGNHRQPRIPMPFESSCLPNVRRRSRWLKILPNGWPRKPFCRFALSCTVLFRAPWIFFAL